VKPVFGKQKQDLNQVSLSMKTKVEGGKRHDTHQKNTKNVSMMIGKHTWEIPKKLPKNAAFLAIVCTNVANMPRFTRVAELFTKRKGENWKHIED
jgi:hypothetical protein